MFVQRVRPTKYVAYAALGALAAGGLAAAWGVAIEPRLIDRREEIGEIPGLPAAWEGRRLALLADLQVGIWLANADTVRRAIRRVIEAKPALALIAGDFVYHAARDPAGAICGAVELVRPLAARVPTYAVLGNHDYATDSADSKAEQCRVADALRRALEAAGLRVLDNEAVPLLSPDGVGIAQQTSLYLVGIGAHLPGEDRPLAALRKVPAEAPRLVFMHNPASFADLPPASAPLALAGHTHGGQIRVPFKPDWTLGRFIVPWPEYLDGWIGDFGQPGNRLYVNRGIGFSHLPVRFGCPPELTFFSLRSARPRWPA